MIDFRAIDKALAAAADQYERSAPTVHAWVDDLCRRLAEQARTVPLGEILFLGRLCEDGVWMQPNYAANALYHLLHDLGRDITGQIGF